MYMRQFVAKLLLSSHGMTNGELHWLWVLAHVELYSIGWVLIGDYGWVFYFLLVVSLLLDFQVIYWVFTICRQFVNIYFFFSFFFYLLNFD